MYHSITFGEKHTYKDWGLIPTERPAFDMPAVKTVYVDIPGADGAVDLSTALTGAVVYENRTGSFEFRVVPKEDWACVYSEIADYLHGQKMKIILDDDPCYYYYGRPQVSKWKSDENASLVTIDVTADPYKYELYSSTEDWVWDTFNFETGIMREYRDLAVNGALDFTFQGSRKKSSPSFTVASEDGKGLQLVNKTAQPWVTVTLSDASLSPSKGYRNS